MRQGRKSPGGPVTYRHLRVAYVSCIVIGSLGEFDKGLGCLRDFSAKALCAEFGGIKGMDRIVWKR